MVLYVAKWQIHPGKVEPYRAWAESGIRRTLAVPGVIEFRGYRNLAGSSQIVVTYEFEDLSSWAGWRSDPEVEDVFEMLFTLAIDVEAELWGPSPIVPEPIQPGD